ncbi:MAG: hypothetical protein K9G44_09600 [Melioribacteraceae bacterium]|nr:hypothetical protein [Melioribacteraceae bacterium]
MEGIDRKYIINENNEKIAVQLDIDTFQKIEEIMENYALFNLMKENESDEILNGNSAKEYYSKLDKSN